MSAVVGGHLALQALGGGPLAAGFDYYYGVDAPNFPPFTFIENNRITIQPTEQQKIDKAMIVNTARGALIDTDETTTVTKTTISEGWRAATIAISNSSDSGGAPAITALIAAARGSGMWATERWACSPAWPASAPVWPGSRLRSGGRRRVPL